MDSRVFLSALFFLSLFSVGACGFGDCPPLDPAMYPLKSGTYKGYPDPVFESGGTQPKVVVIDRQAGTATFTFERRDGKRVVEVWRLTKQTMP